MRQGQVECKEVYYKMTDKYMLIFVAMVIVSSLTAIGTSIFSSRYNYRNTPELNHSLYISGGEYPMITLISGGYDNLRSDWMASSDY